MVSLYKLSKGDEVEFWRTLDAAGWTREDIQKLKGNITLARELRLAITVGEDYARRRTLIHGRFHSLEQKLEMVRSYPDVTGNMLDAALKEAEERIGRFFFASPSISLLDIVVTVYRENATRTFLYARDRMLETHGETFRQWGEAYQHEGGKRRLRFFEDERGIPVVPKFDNCVRIEVVDLGAHLGAENGECVRDVRRKNSATFAPIYAAAQDPDWVREIVTDSIPAVVCPGLEFSFPGDSLLFAPIIHGGGGNPTLGATDIISPRVKTAMAVLWD